MSRQFYTLILIFISGSRVFAQQNWGGGRDDESLHFGFTFQYLSSEFKIHKKANWRDPYIDPSDNSVVTDELYSISSPASQGFGLGFVSNFRLGTNADLRFTPAIVFSDRLLDYRYADPAQFRQKTVQLTLIDLPAGIKLKSDRRKNFRAYIIGGAKYSFDIVSKKKSDDSDEILAEKLVKNTKNILSYEAGIGFDLYFEFFKMSPEIKLSNSFRNVLKAEDHPYSAPLNKLFVRNLQFSLYFE